MNSAKPEQKVTVFTVGHSNMPLEMFLDILKAKNISMLVDIRTVPRSRANPQFNKETLPVSLHEFDISYMHMAGLGGLRRPSPESPNRGWRNSSFRGFADYMQTQEFTQNLEELISYARTERLVLMCAESLPWRCHRSLIADALTVRRIPVQHIINRTSQYSHKITVWAKVEGPYVLYPPQGPGTDSLS